MQRKQFFLSVGLIVAVGAVIGGVLLIRPTRADPFVGGDVDLNEGRAPVSAVTGTPPRNVTVKVTVPDVGVDVGVAVNGLVFKGEGGQRVHKVRVVVDAIIVSAFWEPNNYTKITRKLRVPITGDGEVEADLRQHTDIKDAIVVRFVPTPDDVAAAMCALAKVDSNDVVYDLGCGDAIMLITAVKQFGAKRGVGVELDPKLVKIARDRVKALGLENKIDIRQGDVLKVEDLSDANVVLLYMGDDINNRLKPVLKKTLKPGSRVVSHRFEMGDWKPDKTQHIGANPRRNIYPDYECDILLWTIKARGEK